MADIMRMADVTSAVVPIGNPGAATSFSDLVVSEPETVSSLREFVGKTVASIQRDSAGMYAAAAAARDLGQIQRALFGQDRSAQLHNEATGWLALLADDTYMQEWCDNINRRRYEDERERLRRQLVAEIGQ